MDKIFLRYFKDKKNFLPVAVALALGILLIFIGNRGDQLTPTEEGMEDRIAEACSSIEGVGRCEVMIYYSGGEAKGEGEVQSVIVICDGADSVEVRHTLVSMLSSFFGIGTNRIKIVPLG